MKNFCSYYNSGVCKSCDLITLDYPDQIQLKEKKLKTLLSELKVPSLLTSEKSSSWNFRNKAKFIVTGTMESPVIGLGGEENLDHGRELLSCPLHLVEINDLLPELKKFIQLAKLEPYQISSKKGELKGLILFHSPGSRETYLRFILRSKESVDRIKKNLNFLIEKYPRIRCVSINIQPIPHAILEGEEEIFVTSEKSIEHKLGNISFSLGPRAFVQTNQEVAEKLYLTAADWIKASKLETFLELFCGQGAFSFFCAPYIRSGMGIEINPDAILEASKTAQKYHYHHLSFKSADAGKVEKEITDYKPSIILVNPPRRGLGVVCDLLLKHLPEMIIYSSCNAETLASDLKKLSGQYEITRTQIFDMFPHTNHFETLVELRMIKSIHVS